jgi:hypothetical protein
MIRVTFCARHFKICKGKEFAELLNMLLTTFVEEAEILGARIFQNLGTVMPMK